MKLTIKIDKYWYDLTKFSHPGGDVIWKFNQKDATVAYKTIHYNQNYSKLEKYICENREAVCVAKPIYEFESDFAIDLKCLPFIRDSAPIIWWIRYAVINIFWILFEYLHFSKSNIFISIGLGIVYALMGLCIGHDGSHGSVSKIPRINSFMSRYMDFIGSNNTYWFKQHIMQHHAFTNQSELDPDTVGEPFFVIDPEKRHKNQKYSLSVIWMLGFTIVFNIPRLIKSKDIVGILLRCLFLIKVFHGGIFNGIVVIFTTGFILSNLFIISHNTDETKRNQNDTCWYKCQVESSCTYGGYWAGLVTGGLNDQITHHIFPRMNSCYFPRVQNKVRAICKKHNVKYVYYETIWENYKACYKFLTNFNENVETIQPRTYNKSE